MESSNFDFEIMDGALKDNAVWSIYGGNIIKCDLVTKLVDIIFLDNENGVDNNFVARRAFIIDNYIYFVGNKNIDIYVYEYNQPNILKKHICEETAHFSVKNVFCVEKKFYIVATNLDDGIWIYDTTKGMLLRETISIELQNKELSDLTIFQKNIYCAFMEGEVYKYAIDSGRMENVEIECKFPEPRIRVTESKLYLRERNGYVLNIFDCMDKKWKKYLGAELANNELNEKKGNMLLLKNGDVILLPVYSNTFIRWEKSTEKLKKIIWENENEINKMKGKRTFSLYGTEWNQHLMMFPWATNQICDIDLNNDKVKIMNFKIDLEKCRMNNQSVIGKKKYFYEMDYFNLNDYLNYLAL